MCLHRDLQSTTRLVRCGLSVTERFVDADGDCFCEGTTSAGLCSIGTCSYAAGGTCTPSTDAQGLQTCTEIEFDNKITPGAPLDQTDDDGDCFVECFDGSTSWVGGTALHLGRIALMAFKKV